VIPSCCPNAICGHESAVHGIDVLYLELLQHFHKLPWFSSLLVQLPSNFLHVLSKHAERAPARQRSGHTTQGSTIGGSRAVGMLLAMRSGQRSAPQRNAPVNLWGVRKPCALTATLHQWGQGTHLETHNHQSPGSSSKEPQPSSARATLRERARAQRLSFQPTGATPEHEHDAPDCGCDLDLDICHRAPLAVLQEQLFLGCTFFPPKLQVIVHFFALLSPMRLPFSCFGFRVWGSGFRSWRFRFCCSVFMV